MSRAIREPARLFDDIRSDPVGGVLVNDLHLVGEGLGILHRKDLNALFLNKGDVALLALENRLQLRVDGGSSGSADDLPVLRAELVDEPL
jgi:hypothetical protein